MLLFAEPDGDDEDEYNRTLKDVSLLEDFTLDDDTPTTLPKDPFPPISSTHPTSTSTGIFNEPSSNVSTFHKQNPVVTLNSVLSDDEELAKALIEYNNNTPLGQKTIVIPTDDYKNIEEIQSSQLRHQGSVATEHRSDPLMRISKPLPHSRECRGYIRVVMNLRRPINVLPGTRPPSTYTIITSNRGKQNNYNQGVS